MNNLCVFLNTRVKNSGTLGWVGDKGLVPFRYLFNGKTIQITLTNSDQKIHITHFPSFYSRNKKGLFKSSLTPLGMIKVAISIVLLVPGLFLASFKGLAYLFADMQEKHRLTKEHLTPVNREIGSVSNPITSREELAKALKNELESTPKNPPTHALIIHGDGNLTINEDPGILIFNPMKLVLEGASIVHEPSYFRLDDKMFKTGKWKKGAVPVVTSSKQESSAEVRGVKSIAEALKASAPRRSWFSCKRYHEIFTLAKPQPV